MSGIFIFVLFKAPAATGIELLFSGAVITVCVPRKDHPTKSLSISGKGS